MEAGDRQRASVSRCLSSTVALLSCRWLLFKNELLVLAPGPAGQSWDPFRLPRQPAQVQGSGPASQTVLARKRPNQLVRLPSKPAVPAKGPPGSALPATRGVQQSQQATSARAGVQQGALHSSSTQSQSSSKGYSKPRQTQIVLSKPALPASGQLPASSAAQRAAAAKPQQAARTAQAQHHGGNPPALKRTSYARARPNQLLRLPSLSPGTPRRKRGAAAAQDSPAAKLRKLLLLRRSLSQILALPAQQQPPPSSRLSAAATKPQPTLVKRSRAHLVYVRSAAQGGGSAVGVARIRVPGGKAGAGGPSGQIRRLVYRRAGLAGGVSRAAGSPAARRVPRGSAGGGARVLRARSPAAQPGTSLTWRRVRHHIWQPCSIPLLGRLFREGADINSSIFPQVTATRSALELSSFCRAWQQLRLPAHLSAAPQAPAGRPGA